MTFVTPTGPHYCTDTSGHPYSAKWIKTSASQSIQFLATVSNQRASATQIFGYWVQRALTSSSIVGIRMDLAGIFTAPRPAGATRGPSGVCTAAQFEPFALTGIEGSWCVAFVSPAEVVAVFFHACASIVGDRIICSRRGPSRVLNHSLTFGPHPLGTATWGHGRR